MVSLTQVLEKSSPIGVSEISATISYLFFLVQTTRLLTQSCFSCNALPSLEELNKEHQVLDLVLK
jgi:hypothetical protein